MSSTSTSASLLSRARARDERAWRELVDLYRPLVAHWARGQGLRDAAAADVVQEVFVAASNGLPAFRRDRRSDSFRAWLRTILRSKVADWHRRAGRDPEWARESVLDRRAGEARTPASQSASTNGACAARSLLLQSALERIRERAAPRTYRAFIAVVIEGRSASDVADELGMTSGAVRVAKTRMLQRMRNVLGEID